jgi:hypothetical protein
MEAIRDHYDDIEGEEDAFHSQEMIILIRGLLCVLGALGPAIKIAAMQDIPFTKSIGIIYLVSFLVFEVAVVATKGSMGLEFGSQLRSQAPILDAAPKLDIKRVESFMCKVADSIS